MIVAPSLWGLTHDDVPPMAKKAADNDTSARGEIQVTAAQAGDDGHDQNGRIKSVTFIEREDPFRLHQPGYKPLELMSKNAWASQSLLICTLIAVRS